ncbi:monovalent cation/H+ antiporter complex subunit F [Alkaliphilus serpentinus]|uniref:Cation:proton antiporter n=1 Tax=Alkaliphilus serpentinus TaxID=1482731 RepID=A0A833M9I4_9FIRM|nr:monovalent cation/H+ antiporter complex subunit F [Alkaliphilus serpentinus]KAB3533570.1 cation:proton antiporter [Alkaliphilus serpentinus]
MITNSILVITIFLSVLAFASLYRAYIGPTPADRVVAINVISTKVTVLIVLLAMMTNQDAFVDVAVVYAMMGFVTTVSVSKYMEKGKLF